MAKLQYKIGCKEFCTVPMKILCRSDFYEECYVEYYAD